MVFGQEIVRPSVPAVSLKLDRLAIASAVDLRRKVVSSALQVGEMVSADFDSGFR